MRRTSATLLATIWLLAVPPSSRAQTLPENTATIRGTFVDYETGAPLGGVDLYVLPHLERAPGTQRIEDFPVVAASESDGAFALEMPAGRYRLIPILAGYVYPRLSGRTQFVPAGPWVVAEPAERFDTVTIPLARESAITGQIFDSSGRPLPDVSVRALLRGFDTTGEPRLATIPGQGLVRTDDRGEYRLFGLPPGEYFVHVLGRTLAVPGSYYPGTHSESDALPISLGSGEEVRVRAMTIVEPNTQAVRLNLTGMAPSSTRDWTGLTVSFRDGGGIRLVGRPQPNIALNLPEGSHEALVTWPGEDGMAYRMVTLAVGDEPIDLDLVSGPPIRVTGSIVLEVGGVPSPADEIRCRLRTEFPVPSNNSGDPHCIGQDVVPGPYTLEMPRMPANAYVVSATASGVDMLAAPFRIDESVELEIRIAAPGAAIEGTATDEEGEPLTGATVVLVPDAPLREAGLRYRTVETDIRGRYELTGIAPGSYELFAWSELEGAAYRNADFMADFWGRGIPVRIEDPETIAVDLTAF